MIVKIVVHLSVAVFDLLGGGVNPPLHEDDLPTRTCLGGSALTTPEGFQQQLDKTWGTKKINCVPTFKFVTLPLFVLIISVALNLVS